ncbi:hypothetical protein AAIA71_28545 (plasmid) [Vibrio harveyi]|uniref:hypothetical protein n=1 Tax=Vibrio harveyi TaxID=669 RepID=UPI0024805F9B|nr:hypothetical protein [Vibrio harveyi]
MLNVLKLDGTKKAPSQKLVQLYIATSGTMPSKSEKAVMLPAINAKGALPLLSYDKVKTYLNCKQATLWRLQTANKELDWVKVTSIKDDYRFDDIVAISQTLLEILNASALTSLAKAKAYKLVKSVIFDIYNIPKKQVSDKDPFDHLLRLCFNGAYALTTNDLLPTSWYEALSKSNQTTTNKNTVRILTSIINDLKACSLIIGESREHLEKNNCQPADIKAINTNDKQWYYALNAAPLLDDLSEHNLKLQETLWRIKPKQENKWTLFTANNLAKTEVITHFLAKVGVSKCREAIQENSLPNLAISTIYDNKAEINQELIAAFNKLDFEFHREGGEWESFNPVEMTTSGSLSSKARMSYTLSRKEALAKYGHTGFMSAFMPPLNRYGEPITTRYEFTNWFDWCDKYQPTFQTVADLEGKKQSPKISVRKTKVVVLGAKVKRHMTEARQQELDTICKTATLEFVQVWKTMEELFNLDLPALNVTQIFDTQNKFKEYYINPNGISTDHTEIEINLGCTFNKVDLEDDSQRPTIHYTNPRFKVDSIMTLNDFSKQKAAEIIAEYLATHSSQFANALICHELIDQVLIGKKKALANTLTDLLSNN